ncbi:MAG: hypothetical protein CL778_01125 [Chloroflexi bacterium]|nr:hypothetical protein [Chloroflexota bacterium]|tara:strand:- start:35678 stop:37027 length:1350 start_codon:yes stop_codon:yes gene_type:complete
MNITYENSIKKLMFLGNFENFPNVQKSIKFDLSKISKLLDYCNNPQKNQKFIHVAGTNGKGSTSAIISKCLIGSDLKVGFFSSPSMHKITERIQINNRSIPEKDFANELNNIWPIILKMSKDENLKISFFEAINVMALNYFRKKKVDISVIEVGMGGRLDSTNIITPQISVITEISMDHMSVLGNNIEKITLEKAGIIKNNIPVIISNQIDKVEKGLVQYAQNIGAPLQKTSELVTVSKIQNMGINGSKILFNTTKGKFNVEYPLIGEHQINNLSTALATLVKYSDINTKFNLSSITESIPKVKWAGRFQVLKKSPYLIITDGAHNENAAKALLKTINYTGINKKNIVIILGAGYGHDPKIIMKILIDLNPRIILTKSRHPKSIPVDQLKKILKKYKKNIIADFNDIENALSYGKKIIKRNEVIISTGSLFIAAETIETIKKVKKEFYN